MRLGRGWRICRRRSGRGVSLLLLGRKGREHTSVRTLRLVGRGVVMIANSATVVDAVARMARMRDLEYIFF